jgi:hypothetical protein
MALNLQSTFYKADTILNKLLSKYVGLKLIGFNQSDENKPYYLLSGQTISKGFYHKTRKIPITGETIETLRIVPENSTVNTALKPNVLRLVELQKEDGGFTRFSLQTLKSPSPPNYEWVFKLSPNGQDTTTIT